MSRMSSPWSSCRWGPMSSSPRRHRWWGHGWGYPRWKGSRRWHWGWEGARRRHAYRGNRRTVNESACLSRLCSNLASPGRTSSCQLSKLRGNVSQHKKLQPPGETQQLFSPPQPLAFNPFLITYQLNVPLYPFFSSFLPHPPNPRQTYCDSNTLPGGGSPDPSDDTTGLGAEGGGGASANS